MIHIATVDSVVVVLVIVVMVDVVMKRHRCVFGALRCMKREDFTNTNF